MNKFCAIIPVHKRTVFVQFHQNDVQRFSLCIPQMCLNVNDHEIQYFPYVNEYAYYSPFVNTSPSGFICLGENRLVNWNVKGILHRIYSSVWKLDYETEALGSWKAYCEGYSLGCETDDRELAYYKFLKKWERSGKVDLVVNHNLTNLFDATTGTEIESI